MPDSIEGVKTEDVSLFLGKDSRKYLPVFANIEAKRTNGVHLLVLLLSLLVSPFFAAFWFMQKRMYKIGLLFFCILFALQTGYLVATFSYVSDLLSSVSLGFDYNELLYRISTKMESISTLSLLNSVNQLVSLLISVISGLFANKWYKKHVITTIKSIAAENEEGYKLALVEKGGTKNGLWITLLALTVASIFVISFAFSFAAIL